MYKKVKIIEPKLSKNAREIARKRYLRQDMDGQVLESFGEMLWRVAYHMAKAEVQWGTNGIVMEVAKKFYQRMVEMKMVCAGKAMFEAGNPGGTGQLSSCFVLPIEDSIDKIFKTLGEAAVVHKNNGGTGFNFSAIRPHGDKVRNVPKASSGPVDFIKAYSAALAQILQGAKRQGANIAVLNVDHPDIESFIKMKEEDGTIKNFNISVGVTDKFMKAVEENKMWELINPRTKKVVRRVKARKLFELIARQAHKTGDPGLMFLDTTERGNTVTGFGRLEATNPCVTGDAWITTERGLIRLDELVEEYKQEKLKIGVDARVVNGEGVKMFFPNRVVYTGEKKVLLLTTRHGYRLKVTYDHRVMTTNGWREAGDLTVDDEVLIQAGKGGFSQSDELPFKWVNEIVGRNGRKYRMSLPQKWTKELGFVMGWLVGDGFIRLKKSKLGKEKGYLVLSFGNNRKSDVAFEFFKKVLSQWYANVKLLEPTEKTRQLRLESKFVVDYFLKLGVLAVKSKDKVVPKTIFRAPEKVIKQFLRGLFGVDGTVGYVEGKSAYIRLTSKSKQLLFEVQLLLLQFEIYVKVSNRSRKYRKSIFPEYVDKNSRVKQYDSDGELWELEIAKDSAILFLDKIGFPFGLQLEKIKKLRNKSYHKNYFVDRVQKVEDLGIEKVYDITESATHSFIANGVVVHNCGEIALFPYESCNLTSIDLARHLRDGKQRMEIDWEELEKTVRLGVRFLDNMIEVNSYPIKKIEETVRYGNRRIGLGVMGFAHMLYKMRVAYDSSEAVKIAKKLAKFIYEKAVETSMELAEERGSFPNWDLSIYPAKGQPMRNCAVCMIAPTGTTSMLVDTSSGIEPVFSLVTKRRTFYEDNKTNHSTKELVMVDPVFKEYLKSKKEYIDRIEEVVAKVAEGDISMLTKEERRVFVTTHQIKPKWHIKIQGAWQKYFDNSISKTINFSHQATVEEVKDAYWQAWKEGCKGITIYRDGSKDDQVLVVGKSTKKGEDVCPECGGKLTKVEGCSKCYDCGYSVCG